MNKLEGMLQPLVKNGLKCVLIFGVPAKVEKVRKTKSAGKDTLTTPKHYWICLLLFHASVYLTSHSVCQFLWQKGKMCSCLIHQKYVGFW